MYKLFQIIGAVVFIAGICFFFTVLVGYSPSDNTPKIPEGTVIEDDIISIEIPDGMAIEDGVMFSIDKPLEGKYMEDRIIKINRGDLGINLDVNLKGRKMIRQTESAPWMIDKNALPEGLKKYWDAATI